MDRKSQTALLRRKRQSMIKLLCNKCNGCASSSSHRLQICGSPKKNATIASEVLCVACNTRSAIRSTSSPAHIEICGVPIPPCRIVAVNQPFSSHSRATIIFYLCAPLYIVKKVAKSITSFATFLRISTICCFSVCYNRGIASGSWKQPSFRLPPMG